MTRVIVILAAVAACWVTAVLEGLDAARWCAAGCIALAVVILRALTPSQELPRTPRYGTGRRALHRPYPRLHQLVSTVEWARRDRRYYDRVLTPLLDQIAADVDDDEPVQALRAEIAAALERSERGRRRWT